LTFVVGRSWAVLVAFAMATSVLATQVPSAQATFAGTNGRIAFTRDDGLFTANPDGTDIRLVINDAVALSFGAGTPEWSPDGTTILFDSGHASTEGPPGPGFHIDIYAVDAGGGTPRRLTLSGLNLNASWSPTGRSIAFERSDADCTADHISIMNADGTGIRDLTTNPFGDCKTEEDPSFSPDGTQIVFQRHKSTRNREQSALFVMRSDGSRQRQITGWGTEAGQPDWSPDGAWILFNTASDHFSAQRQIFDSQLGYWKDQLVGAPQNLEVPMDFRRPALPSHRGGKESLALGEDLSRALKNLAESEQSSRFMLLAAVFQTLIYRLTGHRDVVIGSTICESRSDVLPSDAAVDGS
jgi:dipeptidyl aminopeptidase/acylaminoacyl peptidase